MEPTGQEYLYLAGLFALGALLIVAFVSFALHYVVALASPPVKRARWTAGIAYIVAAVALTLPAFSVEPDVELDRARRILLLGDGSAQAHGAAGKNETPERRAETTERARCCRVG